MDRSTPRYLLAPPGSVPDPLRAELAGSGTLYEVDSVELLLSGADGGPTHPPGWIFLPPSTSPDVIVRLLGRLAGEPADWFPLQLVEEAGGWTALPLSTAKPQPLVQVMEAIEGVGKPAGLYSYRAMMGVVSHVRHDINNALTAALAETQLAQLDVEPGTEMETGLQTVESQLRRIRDLVADLGVVRSSNA